MSRLPRIHHGARGVAGPLLYVPHTEGAALGEWASIEVPGQPPRRGQVIEVGRELSVVQVLEETVGLPPARVKLTLRGEQVATPVGTELLGRVLSGSGRPLDGLPAPIGDAWRPIYGAPLNPSRRSKLGDFIETGLSAIDGMNTLVRGQKLPVFTGSGLPGLELAAQLVEGAKAGRDEPFAVIFAGIGITERETGFFADRLAASEAAERSVLFLNRAGDPAIERLLAPRLALTAAEYFAFELGMHVLVVMCDITHYCDALREIGAAREEIPGRRGYPGYMYTDLATLFERAGVLRDGQGSLTQIPILSMPDDDITHPIPDLTGYITEGQIVLSRDLHRAAVFPPIDVLPSLSRVMNAGIGEGRTMAPHRAWSDQLYAIYALGRDARLTAGIVGESGLSEPERRALAFALRFEREIVHQGTTRRSLDETFELGWRLLEELPRSDLSRLDEAAWAWRSEQRKRAHERRVDMSPARRAPPTRHALLRVRRRLDRVNTAAELLGRKRKALVSELFLAARPVLDAREAVQWQAAVAFAALLRAQADRGRALLEATARPIRELQIELAPKEIWGMPAAEIVTHDPVRRPSSERGFDPSQIGPAAHATAEAFETLTQLLLDSTSRELRIRRLAHALAETSRRVNLLERRVAPALAADLARIAATLEEREREEQLRYRQLLGPARRR